MKQSVRLTERQWVDVERALLAAADVTEAAQWNNELRPEGFRLSKLLGRQRMRLRDLRNKIADQRRGQ